jgi:CheY-like chemotaxis protein
MGDGPIADNAEILPGFPPGKPRVMFVHRQTRIHDDIKDKLERRGYSTICNADLGRALMLHDIRPFHCLVIDLPTTGKEGVKAYVKAKRKAQEKKLQMAGIFLAADAEQQKWTHDLNVDLTETLYGQPVTLTEVRRALARLLPGIDKEDPADGA